MEKFTKLTDDQLVALYQEGEYKAFDELLARCQDCVYQYLYFMLNDEDAANDAFQDTFVRAIMALREGRYRQNGQFRSWLLRVARNLVIDKFRGDKARRTTPLEMEDAQGETVVDVLNTAAYSEPDVEMATVLTESAEDVKMMINRGAARGNHHAFLPGAELQGDCRPDGCEHQHCIGPHALCANQPATHGRPPQSVSGCLNKHPQSRDIALWLLPL